MITIIATNDRIQHIGYQTENNRTKVLFDVSDVMAEYPDGLATLSVQRPGDCEGMISASTEMEGIYLAWTVESYFLENRGTLRAQVEWRVPNVIAKQKIYKFTIDESLIVSAEAPDGWQTILDQLLDGAAHVHSELAAAQAAMDASVQAAADNALKAEGHASGTQDGTAVGSDSPYYQDNAFWYSQQAQQSATDSNSAVTQARHYAQQAEAAKDIAVRTNAELTAEAGQLPEGSEPTAHIDRTGDHPVLELGIPKGDSGDPGVYIGTTEPTNPNTQIWLNPNGHASVIPGIPRGNSANYVGTCSTMSSVFAKEVVCPDYTELVEGDIIDVAFEYSHASIDGDMSNLTLNVNGTGAKPIRRLMENGTVDAIPTSSVKYFISRHRISRFRYDGTYWVMIESGLVAQHYINENSNSLEASKKRPVLLGEDIGGSLDGVEGTSSGPVYRTGNFYTQFGSVLYNDSEIQTKADLERFGDLHFIDTVGEMIHDQYNDEVESSLIEQCGVIRFFFTDSDGYVLKYTGTSGNESYTDADNIRISAYVQDSNIQDPVIIANGVEMVLHTYRIQNTSVKWAAYDPEVSENSVPYSTPYWVEIAFIYRITDVVEHRSSDGGNSKLVLELTGIGTENGEHFSLLDPDQPLEITTSIRGNRKVLIRNIGLKVNGDLPSDVEVTGFKMPEYDILSDQKWEPGDVNARRIVGYLYNRKVNNVLTEYYQYTESENAILLNNFNLYITNGFMMEPMWGLKYDDIPTLNSNKLLTSGTVYAALLDKLSSQNGVYLVKHMNDDANDYYWNCDTVEDDAYLPIYRTGMTIAYYFKNKSFTGSGMQVYIRLRNQACQIGSAIMLNGAPVYNSSGAAFTSSCVNGKLMYITFVGDRWVVA